jgi:hypothetical protein
VTSRVPALIVHGGTGADPASGREELRRGTRDAVAAGWAHSTPLMPVGFMSPGHDAPALTF